MESRHFNARNLQRQFLAMSMDVLCAWLALLLAISLREDSWVAPHAGQMLAYVLAPALAIPIMVKFGLYRAIFRYTGFAAMVTTMQAIAEEYAQEHPGFKLTLITTPDRPSYIQKYETLAAANKLPELFDTDATPFARKLASKNQMVDVAALLDNYGITANYRPSALDYQRFDDGSLYMIPLEYGIEVFWYNKALFAAAGA